MMPHNLRSVRRIVSDEARACIDMAEILRRDDAPMTPEDVAEQLRIERRARLLVLRDLDACEVHI